MASFLNQILGDDRYQKRGKGGCKRQPRDSGREHEDLVGARPNISLLQQRQPKRWAEPEGTEVLLRQQCCSDPNLNFWKKMFNSKSFQLFLSFGLPCSVGPLQSPVRKPTVPGWSQFFCQDHWGSCQSQRQNCCVPPALASLPLQPNYREQTQPGTLLENQGRGRERERRGTCSKGQKEK